MADFYFRAAFGRVPLLVVEIDSDGGRELAIHSPTRGDRHVLQDRGQVVRRARVELLFVDQPGQDPPLDRFRAFQALANAGTPDVFYHPIDGSFRAVVDEFRYSLSAEQRRVTVQCTFVALDEPEPILAAGAGVSPSAGVEEVSNAAARVDAEIARAGLTSSLPRECVDRVVAWAQADEPDSRAVYLELASLSSRLSDEVERLKLVTDLSRWEIYRAFVGLQYQVQRAAEAVASDAERVFDLRVEAAIPLRVLCARVYGAADAEERARQVQRLNNLRAPLIPAGTTLKMPAAARSTP